MKSGCIVFAKKGEEAFNGRFDALLNELSLSRYAPEEVRILCTQSIKEIFADFKKIYPIIFLITEEKIGVEDFLTPTQVEGIYTDGKTVVCLLPLVKLETCLQYLDNIQGVQYKHVTFKTVGAKLAHVEDLLAGIQASGQGHVICRHLRKYDEDTLRIYYECTLSKDFIDWALRRLAEGLGDTVYALDDVTLEEQLVFLLKLRGKRLSVAESFTGGGVGRRIVSVSGASEVYFEGLNTYNENSKVKRLGVSQSTLAQKGAVSKETAYEMARGLLSTGDCDIAVTTTGLAGPNGDAFGKPVGYCCIAVGTRERISVYQYNFEGNRKEITEKAIHYALFLAYKCLKDI